MIAASITAAAQYEIRCRADRVEQHVRAANTGVGWYHPPDVLVERPLEETTKQAGQR